MSLREIEVKATIENFGHVIRKLEKLGCSFSEPIIQEDIIYLPSGIGVDDVKQGINALRLRKENGKVIFNLKQRLEVSLACIEREVVVENLDAMAEIIALLGFYEFQKIKKKRKKCQYKDYEICLDEVEDLGCFIEVEKMSDENSSLVQEELFQFLESLGIERKNRATRGYDILLYNKRHKK